MVCRGQQRVSSSEIARLLGLSLYDAKIWCLEVSGEASGMSTTDLFDQVKWVPVESVRKELPSNLHRGAISRARRHYYRGYSNMYVHVRDLLILCGKYRGTLRCLAKILRERPERDPLTGKWIYWGMAGHSANSSHS